MDALATSIAPVPEVVKTARAGGEIRALTGLRGVCAFDVVLGHYSTHRLAWLTPFIFHDAAVDIFFALSSFTLCLVYGSGDDGRRIDWRDFAIARFARIYPLYAAATLAGVVLDQRPYVLHWGSAGGHAMLIHTAAMLSFAAGLPIPAISGYWFAAAWSIPVEVFCYILAFPLLRALAPHLRSARALLLLVFAVSAFSLVMFIRHSTPVVNNVGMFTPDLWAYWTPLFRGFAMFTAGWAIFIVYERAPAFGQGVGLATDAIAAFAVFTVIGEWFDILRRHAVILLAPFLIAGLMDRRSVTARLLGSGPLHWLGLISYSVYLLHIPVHIVVWHYLPGLASHEALGIAVPAGATLVVASCSYVLFEKPARRLIRAALGARRRTWPPC